jgi:dTDP-4-amino-4,6-dideoxygalactose transaminase
MDPVAAAAAITPKTKALMPVHLFGLIADMDALGALATKHNLAMIEDACQAVGATQNGKQAGSFGVGAFSLYATKNITSGEGGMITTNDDTLNEWLRTFRSQGMKVRYLHEMLGTNYRMTDIAAAIGIVQLGKLDQFTAARVTAASRYDALLAGAPIVRQGTPPGNLHVYHQYTVHVGPARDEIVKDLANDGIGTGVYYPIPVSQQPYIKERGLDVALPVTDALAKGCLSLPMFAAITAAEQEEVAASLRRAVERHGGSAWPA